MKSHSSPSPRKNHGRTTAKSINNGNQVDKDEQQGETKMREADAWDKAIAAESRRCKRLDLVFQQPDATRRQESYEAGDLVELRNVNGRIATYRVGPTGRVTRQRAWVFAKQERPNQRRDYVTKCPFFSGICAPFDYFRLRFPRHF